jgi:hypothetical protein
MRRHRHRSRQWGETPGHIGDDVVTDRDEEEIAVG